RRETRREVRLPAAIPPGSFRHGRPCAGHLDWKGAALHASGITGTSPVMTFPLSWPGLTRPSQSEKRRASQDRDHRHKAGDDEVEGPVVTWAGMAMPSPLSWPGLSRPSRSDK